MKNSIVPRNVPQAIVGGVYSYVNKYNYVTILKVSRITDKSVFVYYLLDNGNFSSNEHRESLNSFKKYTYQPNCK